MVCSFPSNDRGLVNWIEAYWLRSGQTAFNGTHAPHQQPIKAHI